MHHRAKIPGFALLTLSLTDCVDRSNLPGEGDPIVGDWHAVKVDGEVFPMDLADGPYTYEANLELSVEETLAGELLITVRAEEDGYISNYGYGSTLLVDASAAPKYRIDVTRDLFGRDEPYTGEVGYATAVTGYDSGYQDTAPPSDTDTDTDGGTTSAGTGGAHERPNASRPLHIPLEFRLAPAEMVLRCTLSGDTLNCDRDGDDLPNVLVFKRTRDD